MIWIKMPLFVLDKLVLSEIHLIIQRSPLIDVNYSNDHKVKGQDFEDFHNQAHYKQEDDFTPK